MRRFAFVVVVLLALPALSSAAGSRPGSGWGKAGYVPGQIVVQFKEEAADEASVAELLRLARADEARRSQFVRGLHLVTLRQGDSVEEALRRFATLRQVEFAEPNYVYKLSLSPSDPAFRVQWNFRMLNAERMWDIQQGSSSVTVAVIDSGVATEDLGRLTIDLGLLFGEPGAFKVQVGPFAKAPDWGGTRFAPGFDALFGSGHAFDDQGHGTHVASTIAEATNNSLGAAGLAFGVTLMPIKACLSQPSIDPDLVGCTTLAIADGIDFARTNGAKVISMSLGGGTASETLRRAVERAAAANLVIVAAAGNENGPVSFPAAFPQVIAVGAVDLRKQRAFYSNFGPELDFVAPGGDLTVDRDGDGFADGVFQQTMDFDLAEQGIYTRFAVFALMGTSMATPHVSAFAALLISQGITDPTAVRTAMEQTAEDLGPAGRDNQYGFGLIDPVKALTGLGLNR